MAGHGPLHIIQNRIMRSMVPAALGGAVGYGYAYFTLAPDVFASSSFPGMYAACGAAAGILAVRLVALFRALYEDFFGRDRSDKDV